MAIYDYAAVGNQDQAKNFFEAYGIPYQTARNGERKGALKVKRIRETDSRTACEIIENFRSNGYEDLCEHINIFRDEDDNTVVTFSPYAEVGDVSVEDGEIKLRPKEIKISGYDVEVSNYSIYGMGTRTVVVRKKN